MAFAMLTQVSRSQPPEISVVRARTRRAGSVGAPEAVKEFLPASTRKPPTREEHRSSPAMSAAASLTLLELPDRLIKFVLSSTSSPPTLAAAAATCRRLNSMVTEPFSEVWQLLNSGANIDWAEGAVTAQDAVPAKDSQCNLALAIDREAVLFSDGEQSLHLSPPPGTASAALTLREAAACAQAWRRARPTRGQPVRCGGWRARAWHRAPSSARRRRSATCRARATRRSARPTRRSSR